MARLTDPDRLAAFKDAVHNWQFTGYVQFELSEQAYQWIGRELGGITASELALLIHEHVAGGGDIDEVAETRQEWQDRYKFHYDLRLTIKGAPVYIETRLHYRLPIVADESWILVVNVHAP